MSYHRITIFKRNCKCHLGLSDPWNTLFVLITCHYCFFVLFVFPNKLMMMMMMTVARCQPRRRQSLCGAPIKIKLLKNVGPTMKLSGVRI